MGFTYHWRTEQGKRSNDNWDFCGIGLRSDISLSIVLDGSTSGANSGDFARKLATHLIDWFMAMTGPVTADAIIGQLREIHKALATGFRNESASYAIVLTERDQPFIVFHAGDCLVGKNGCDSPVLWQTKPHTLANAISDLPIDALAQSPLRNRLTRSFRTREFLEPELSSINSEGVETIVVATDGFWADLKPSDQNKFLKNKISQKKDDQDDCSALEIKVLPRHQDSQISSEKTQNIYIVDSR